MHELNFFQEIFVSTMLIHRVSLDNFDRHSDLLSGGSRPLRFLDNTERPVSNLRADTNILLGDSMKKRSSHLGWLMKASIEFGYTSVAKLWGTNLVADDARKHG
jgi:hypothetical protein